jgi:PST family polysaccharide transporter
MISQASSLMIPLLLLPFLTRFYAPLEVGYYIFHITIVSIGFLIFDFGMSTYGVQKVISLDFEKKEVSKIYSISIILKTLLIVVFTGVISILFIVFDNEYLYVALLSVPSVFFQSLIPYWLLQAHQKMKIVAIINIISRILSVSFALICIVFIESSIFNIILISSIGWFVSFLVLYILLKGKIINITLDLKRNDFNNFYSECRSFYASRISSVGYLYANVLVVSSTSPYLLAFYGVSEYIYKILQSVLQAFNQALYPYVAKTKDVRTLYLTLILLLFFVLFFLLVFNLTSEKVVTFLYGAEYLVIIPYVNAFICLSFVGVFSFIFGFPAASLVSSFTYVNFSCHLGLLFYLLLLSLLWFVGAVEPLNLIYIQIVNEVMIASYRLLSFVAKRNVKPSRKKVNNIN